LKEPPLDYAAIRELKEPPLDYAAIRELKEPPLDYAAIRHIDRLTLREAAFFWCDLPVGRQSMPSNVSTWYELLQSYRAPANIEKSRLAKYLFTSSTDSYTGQEKCWSSSAPVMANGFGMEHLP
jgi:hypothetical protein